MSRDRPDPRHCKPSTDELLKALALKIDGAERRLGRKMEKLMSELTNVATDLKTANTQLASIRTGITKIGLETAKLVQQAVDAETPEEKAAVATGFDTLKEHLGAMGADVKAIDDLVPDVTEPPVDPNV